MRMILIMLMLLISVSTAWAQSELADLKAVESALATADSTVDRVIEEHIMRLVFDNTYEGGSLEDAAATDPSWVEWEEYYFNRESYRLNLENFIQEHWSLGPWWWQARIRVEVIDELDRGGPLHFKVDYPLLDFRDDLVYQVSKDVSGQTEIDFSGKFNSQRFGYLMASAIMLITLVILGLIGWGILKLLWKIFDALVTALADQFTGGRGHSTWAWRFAACIVGAVFCGIGMIAWAFLYF